VPATAILPAVVQVNAPVGINVIAPPPAEIGLGAVMVTIAVVPETKAIGVVGAIVVALAIVGAAALTALKLLNTRLVPVAAPMTGVTRVGVFANTAEPVPVSSVKAVRKLALLGVAKNVATPVPKPLTPVATGKPVQLVNVPLVGVPSIGVTIVILVLVQALILPLATVPNAGATNVELVNSKALVTCLVVPDCTIGKTSATAAAVATGRAVIAMVAMLVVSCVNVKALTSGDNGVRHRHYVIRVVDALQIAFAGHGDALDLGAWLNTKLGGKLHRQVVDKRSQITWREQNVCRQVSWLI